MANMSKRFLNVVYECRPTRIDTLDMHDLVEVLKEIKLAYGDMGIVGYSGIQLWETTESMHYQDLNDIRLLPLPYFQNQQQGRRFLTVKLLPSPAHSREASSTAISTGIILLTYRRKTSSTF
jgi:hypothetical protein